MPLISLLKIDNFDRVRDVRPRMLSDSAVAAVKELDEADEIEPWIQAIFYDTNRTPHGPSELVDILTHKTTVRGREGVGAFILDQIAKINMITIQSLIRNLPIFADARVDYLIIDEFHQAAANSYRVAIDALSPTFLLGLTATPFRGDRQDVLMLCNENIIVRYEVRQGIELGILCPSATTCGILSEH